MTVIESILNTLGEYSPIVVDITSNGSTVQRVVPDFGYIAASVLLIVGVYSVFRIIGSALLGGRR